MLDEHVRKEKERELSEKYASMFRAKITHLLDFIGPKTPTERTKDILDLRNEFFAYPVKIEQSLLETFQTKQIDYFGDISKEALTNNDPFRDFFMEAMEYSQEAVPVFDQKKHLFPHFTGFVGNVRIWPEDLSAYTSPIFEARGAYIKNGKIIWSIIESHA